MKYILLLALLLLIPLAGIVHAETFSYTVGTSSEAQMAGTASTACSTTGDQVVSREFIIRSDSGSALDPSCTVFLTEWDLSSFPNDLNANVTDAKLRIDVDVVNGDTVNCNITKSDENPSDHGTAASDAKTMFDEVRSESHYLDNDSFCTTTGTDKIVTLGGTSFDDIEAAVQSDDKFTVGFEFNDWVRNAGQDAIDFGVIELQIEYEFVVFPITDLSCVFDNADTDNYNVDCSWSEPIGNVTGYQINRWNSTDWFTLVNDTGTTDVFYNDTALHQSIFHAYNVTGWGVNQGPPSNLQNVTTIDPLNATMTSAFNVVGDILLSSSNFTAISSFPDPQIVNQIKTFFNSTLVDTDVISQSWANFTNPGTFYQQIGTSNTTVSHQARVINFTGDPVLINSIAINATRVYDPDYFVSQQGGYQVNYTLSRDPTQTDLNLKVNRVPINFQIECLYQTPIQAVRANMTDGIWTNKTDVGFLDDHIAVQASDNIYITCYNDELLFTTTSYTNSSQTLLGIEIYDDIYGGFLGVPVGIFFLILVAGYANQRTAPTWTVIILAMAGILATIGFFTLDVAVWGLMLIAGMLGLLVGRKVF